MRQHNEKSQPAISIMLALRLFKNSLLGAYYEVEECLCTWI